MGRDGGCLGSARPRSRKAGQGGMPSGPYSFIEKTEARLGSSPRTSPIMPK